MQSHGNTLPEEEEEEEKYGEGKVNTIDEHMALYIFIWRKEGGRGHSDIESESEHDRIG